MHGALIAQRLFDPNHHTQHPSALEVCAALAVTSMGILMTRIRACAVVGATVAWLGAQGAVAADLGSGPPGAVLTGSPWTFIATPYAWAPFIQGDATVRQRTANIYVNPFELIDHLERMPWMSYIEARNGRLALYNDIVYANAGIGASGVRRIGSATIAGSLGADFEQTIVEVGGAYQIAKWWSGASGSLKDGYAFNRYTAIDLIAGARYWRQELNINLALTGTLDTSGLIISGNHAIARSGEVSWVDPLVGFRIRQSLAPGQELMFRADIGGFDAGSMFSWNIVAAYNFNICVFDGVTYTGMLGYRALSVNYDNDGSGFKKYELDAVMHGPVMGISIKF